MVNAIRRGPEGKRFRCRDRFRSYVQQLRRAYLSSPRLPCERSFSLYHPRHPRLRAQHPLFLFCQAASDNPDSLAYRPLRFSARASSCSAVALGNNEVPRQLPAASFSVYIRRAVKCARRELWRNSVPSLYATTRPAGRTVLLLFFFFEREVGG